MPYLPSYMQENLVYGVRLNRQYGEDSSYSDVYENESNHTIVYGTEYENRVEFLKHLGLLHDSAVYYSGRYYVTVTKLVPYEKFNGRQSRQYWYWREKYDIAKWGDLEQIYKDAKRNKWGFMSAAIVFIAETYGVEMLSAFDGHTGNVMACPITGKLYCYDMFNQDWIECQM